MSIVYELWHLYETNDDEEHNTLIGIYSTEWQANQAMVRARGTPKFCDYPEDFLIDKSEVDCGTWLEGFGVEHNDDDQ